MAWTYKCKDSLNDPLLRRSTLFNNSMIKDYPQWYLVYLHGEDGSAIDEIIISTGMVVSKGQLKRLYKQNAVKIVRGDMWYFVSIGKRRLIMVDE